MQTLDPATELPDPLLDHAARIRASGVLGKSGHIRRLFDFLVDCAQQGRVPKEIEVAIDGFGRDAGFDASQDALVRVYVHKLRRRLETYYARPEAAGGPRLQIPRGEYRLEWVSADAPLEPVLPAVPVSRYSRREAWGLALIGVLVFAVGLLGLDRLRGRDADPALTEVRRSAVWAPLLADDSLPIVVVLGDYYIFGEREPGADVPSRLVREYDINSREDLERRIQQQPSLSHRMEDLGLGYLPTSSAQALRDVLSVLAPAGKRLHITLASEFSPATFKSSHVVYIGYLSGMGMLQDVIFGGSRFGVGTSFDELVDSTNGKSYVSEAGGPLEGSARYRDYAYLSTFAGPQGTRHVVIAGTRDTALRQAAEMVSDPRRIAEISARTQSVKDIEALYEVYGVSRANIEARLLVAAPLDSASIWSDPLPDAASQPSSSAAGSGLLTK